MTRGVAGFAREEDVDLGLTVRLGLLAAPAVFGYERDGIGPQLNARAGGRVPGGFGYLEALANGVYDSEGLDSGSVQLAATAVLQPAENHVGILHVEGGWLKIRFRGGNSIWDWVSDPGRFRATPSPAIAATSGRPSTG